MTKIKNIHRPKIFIKYNIFYFVLIAFISTLGMIPLFKYLYSPIKEDLIKVIVYIILVGLIWLIYLIMKIVLSKAVYKFIVMNGQNNFYTSDSVYITQKKECTEIIIYDRKYIFIFTNGLKLKCILSFLLTKSKNRLNENELNKKNFPNANIIIKKKA